MNKGFTLAEVLITLTIVGVIASMTIPSLISSSNDAEYYTTYKKAYSDLAAATKLIAFNKGGTIYLSTFANDEAIIDEYKKYLSIVRTCNGTNIDDDLCMGENYYEFTSGAQFLTNLQWFNDASSAAVLNNGTVLYIYKGSELLCDDSITTHQECARMGIDINGSKGPNIVGVDFFSIMLHQDRIGGGKDWGDTSGKDAYFYGGNGIGMSLYCLSNDCPQ